MNFIGLLSANASSLNFAPMNFIYALKWLGLGMLGIMIVMGVIIIATIILNKVTSTKENEDK